MRYLVDTNVISELRKGSRCHPGVAAFFREAPAESLFLSVLTLGELRKGIEQIRRRDPQQAEILHAWLNELQRYYSSRILGIDADLALRWGEISALRSLPVIDALLAATALEYGLTLVTRNARDVKGTGAVVLDPFK